MRTLNELHSRYQDQVETVLVTTDPAETKAGIRDFLEQQHYPWDPALGQVEMLASYGVFTQSTKIAVDRDGVITFRSGYGGMSPEAWEQLFRELAES